MKTRMLVEVGAFERYVIARYFSASDGVSRTRATRAQVRRFVAAAVQAQVRDLAADMRGKQRGTSDRLRLARDGASPAPERVRPRTEREPSLFSFL